MTAALIIIDSQFNEAVLFECLGGDWDILSKTICDLRDVAEALMHRSYMRL